MAANISIRNLVRDFRLGEVTVHVLKGISFEIDRGDFVAIMGPSGSGKSTLMNLLGCLDRPTSGTYVLDGVDVSRLDGNQRANRLVDAMATAPAKLHGLYPRKGTIAIGSDGLPGT